MKQITVGGLNVAVAHVGGAFYVRRMEKTFADVV